MPTRPSAKPPPQLRVWRQWPKPATHRRPQKQNSQTYPLTTTRLPALPGRVATGHISPAGNIPFYRSPFFAQPGALPLRLSVTTITEKPCQSCKKDPNRVCEKVIFHMLDNYFLTKNCAQQRCNRFNFFAFLKKIEPLLGQLYRL